MRHYCTFEDRPSAQIGLKLLILSLEDRCRDFTLHIGFLQEQPAFSDWLRRHAPHARLVFVPHDDADFSVWQIKARLMLQLLDEGLTDITWLDADLIVLRDFGKLLDRIDPRTLVVAQEMDYPFHFKPYFLELYGLKPFRRLDYAANTCVMRLTDRHRPLLEKWIEFMKAPYFQRQYRLPRTEQDAEFEHDQTLMEILLSGSREDWLPTFPVRLLRQGSVLIQELGASTYHVRDRLRNGIRWGKPWVVHILGVKPWDPAPASRRYRSTSVYSAFAERYRDRVEEPMDWPNSHGHLSRLGRWLSLGQPHWMGIARCVAGRAAFYARSAIQRWRGKADRNGTAATGR